MNIDGVLEKKLQRIRDNQTLRELETMASGQGPYVQIGGKRFLNLCSNDYLALAGDARIKQGAVDAVEKWGGGSGASRLLTGNLDIHTQVEKKAAALVGKPAALVFSSGYSANLGLISSLAGPGDLILSDELNHASLIDGCRLSKARTVIYRHMDMADLEEKITTIRGQYDQAFIITESYFSMDGDLCPLSEVAVLAAKHQCALIVDEAHAVGVWGDGRGLCSQEAVTDNVTAIIGTFGKAFGSQGAFVAGSETLRAFLINRARSFIFSTAPAPAVLGAAHWGLDRVEKNGARLTQALFEKTRIFREALVQAGAPVKPGSIGQIVPVVLKDVARTMACAEALRRQGILTKGIRPPTVPENSSRIRFSVTIGHETPDLHRVAKLVGEFVGNT